MADTTEPAIPVVAPVPLHAQRSLLNIAERDWPALTQPGALVDVRADKSGASVLATVSLYEGKDNGVVVGFVGRTTYRGEWEAGGFIRWTRA